MVCRVVLRCGSRFLFIWVVFFFSFFSWVSVLGVFSWLLLVCKWGMFFWWMFCWLKIIGLRFLLKWMVNCWGLKLKFNVCGLLRFRVGINLFVSFFWFSLWFFVIIWRNFVVLLCKGWDLVCCDIWCSCISVILLFIRVRMFRLLIVWVDLFFCGQVRICVVRFCVVFLLLKRFNVRNV